MRNGLASGQASIYQGQFHIPESQDWVLEDLEMGPFVMDNNFGLMEEIFRDSQALNNYFAG